MLIPLALKGVTYKPIGASALLRRNLLIYGLGGIIIPFIGIKLIDYSDRYIDVIEKLKQHEKRIVAFNIVNISMFGVFLRNILYCFMGHG